MDNCYWPQDHIELQLHPWLPPPHHDCFDTAADDRAATASRSHSEAEKRRRDRINAQLATLRKLIPKSEKVLSLSLLLFVSLSR